jgi:hypothetical protein
MGVIKLENEGHRVKLAKGLLNSELEYIYESLNYFGYSADLFSRSKTFKGKIPRQVKAVYFKHNDQMISVVTPSEAKVSTCRNIAARKLKIHRKSLEELLPPNPKFPGAFPEREFTKPFPYKSEVGWSMGIKGIIVSREESLADTTVHVPFEYGNTNNKKALWLPYDYIFAVLKDAFGDLVK